MSILKTREIRGPNAFKTRLKCTCHEIALSVTRQTCTWNCPAFPAPELLTKKFTAGERLRGNTIRGNRPERF